MVCLWLLTGLGGIFSFIQLKKIKKVVDACKAPASASVASLTSSDTYSWLWCLYWRFRRVIGFVSTSSFSLYGACIVVRRGLAENGFFIYFHSLSSWICVQAMQKIKMGLQLFFFFIQSLFSYLQFFLHWLFLIGFYFLFHPWSFDFLILFSNLVLILWIAIYFILNCFLNLFVFLQFHPRYFFHLIFASNLVMFLLVAIFISFLMDWFFTISSLYI